jgi:hypothetical protein
MSDLDLLDRTYHAVMSAFVETGRAPHYTELATTLGVPLEQARGLLHELVDSGLPGWMEPGQDVLVSLAPFSSLPNAYRVTIDGNQRWFAQ